MMSPKELAQIFAEIDAEQSKRTLSPPRLRHECDCGRRFDSLEAMYCCQASNHQ